MKEELDKAIPEFLEQTAKIYAAKFTESELQDVIDFYESPTGKKFQQLAPELMQESMKHGQTLGQECRAARHGALGRPRAISDGQERMRRSGRIAGKGERGHRQANHGTSRSGAVVRTMGVLKRSGFPLRRARPSWMLSSGFSKTRTRRSPTAMPAGSACAAPAR